ncbi:MAG: glycosyltransferase [Ornithinimicrobium sp.]
MAEMIVPVDVVIAVHTPTRPIARAVASVLDGNAEHARLTLVCHNVGVEQIQPLLEPAHREQITWLEHHDGTPSASGPFNVGMRAAPGDFVSIMGSDDTVQPGAIASWLHRARQTGADCVMTRLAIGSTARRVPTPPTRLLRRQVRLTDVVRDRLSYRSAPLGLVSTRVRDRLGAELVEGLPVGGDVPYVTRLWCETKVAVDGTGPAYVIGEDARDRVTYAPRPVDIEVGFVRHLVGQPWFTAYPELVRTAVATKLLRIHLFGVVLNRGDPTWWTPPERQALADVVADVLVAAPRAADPLSVADHRLIEAMQNVDVDAQVLIQRATDRRRHGRPTTVIPKRLTQIGHREAPPRFMAASWVASR